ncbi:MAG: UvrD-helicase domain-containing protein [Gammaproteobacteria bacterium]|nr:UvrD-helicase domain-containing protein [Gammaproteobacteria bacterium]
MTAERVIDAEQRQRALEIAASFIVQAPAGSGKTELLTQRFLRLLAVVDEPEEICAITFTRKAAAEMRQRIVSALAGVDGPRPAAAHAGLTWTLAGAALQRDAERGWQLLRNPNRLRIQTFDSLAHSLARQLPILSEFGAVPTTTEDVDGYYRDAARATLRALEDSDVGPHLARLLEHLDNRHGQLEELLCAMLRRRDQWLPHVIDSPDGGALDDALGAAVSDHLRQLLRDTPADWLAALVDAARAAAERLDGEHGATTLRGWRGRSAPPGSDWSELPAWQGLAELVLTAGGDVRRRWDAKLGFPPPSASGIGSDEKARRQRAKRDVQGLADALAGSADLVAAWHGLRGLPATGLDAGQHAVLGALFQVLLRTVAELRLGFRDAGEVDFCETQMRAQHALGTADAPSDLALALDYRLQHLLVDEFQDTSSSQYRLLATLTATWQPGDGRTLFAVGDPMQSIYRFREAEVGLYLAAREHGIGQLALQPLTLAVNFRSARGIVDWVNAGFARLFPTRVDVARGAVDYAPAQAFHAADDGPAVQVHAQAGADPRAEAEQVVGLVNRALAETSDGQVAVLARARRHLHAIAAALKAAGVSFQAVDVDPLAGQPVVRDLYFLTRALLHPGDRLAWLTVLRAPWLGLDLADLLVVGDATSRCIVDCLLDPQVRERLSDDGRERVARLLDCVDNQLPARGRRPLREWIEGIWLRLGGAAVAGAAAAEDAQAFLALLDRHAEAAGLVDFQALELAMQRLYAAPDSLADGRVQLMTMHKSKGLEFDTVILPSLGRRTGNAGAELFYWLERPRGDGRVALLMAPIRAARQPSEPISAYLRDLDRDKSRLETTRLLYVAATRARRRLHLLGHIGFGADGTPRAPVADSLLERLWPVVEPAFAALEPPAEQPRAVPADAPPLYRLAADWAPDWARLGAPPDPVATAADPPTTIEFDWAGDSARLVGTLVHRWLERIADDGIDDWPAARVDELTPRLRIGLRHLGVDPSELDAALDKTQRALRQTLDDETGRWILSAHRDARCEWPLTVHDDGAQRYVIDRSFVDDSGTRWIIDYKTGEHLDGDREAFLDAEQQRYRQQLLDYAAIVRRFESRPIRLALYFPLFADWRVWDFDG